MKIAAVKIEVPDDILGHWQEICDILAGIAEIPAALIMRLSGPDIEVCVSSDSDGNPYRPGDKETLADSGLYCETVLKTQGKLHVPDALADADWKQNPDIKLNMISYLGFPTEIKPPGLFFDDDLDATGVIVFVFFPDAVFGVDGDTKEVGPRRDSVGEQQGIQPR